MKAIFSLALILSVFILPAEHPCFAGKLKIISTFCNNKPEPLGIPVGDFTFSWKMESPDRNVIQTAYQIIVFRDQEKDEVWNSGKIISNQSIWVAYGGPALLPGNIYHWKVKVWDNRKNESFWSNPAKIVTGLFTERDWAGAQWIGYDEMDSTLRIVPGIHSLANFSAWKNKPFGNYILPVLRKEFFVKKPLKQALVYVSGLGQYELDLNGKKIGDRFLSPGWTQYDSICFYNVFDVTSDLAEGKNAWGMWLGNGFFNVPNLFYWKLITAYGNPKMIMKLLLTYKDGSREEIVSDGSWKTAPGPITYSSIYGGETYNANLEQPGWNQTGFDDTSWENAAIVKAPCKKMEAEEDYPVKVMEKIGVKSVSSIDNSGRYFLYDFGQNASGIVEIEVSGNKGDTVKLVPAELIARNLEPNQNATGKPYFLTYILKGTGTEIWSPRFTYYGFRYVGVIGAVPDTLSSKTGLPRIRKMTLLHTRNSATQTGSFVTSEELFNRINRLIRWAVRSNLQSVVTDCPHREKLGWLEQTHLMGNSIHYNYDIYSLYKKQISDMMTAQFSDGMVPDIAPEFVRFTGGFVDSPEWGSAAVILPWLIYQWYGDAREIQKAWPMMVHYVDYLKTKSHGQLLDYGLGDWCDLGPKAPGVAQLTPVKLTATAFYFYDVKLMSEMARVLGKNDEIKKYTDLADEIKAAFNREFFNPETNIYSTGSQTAIAIPLVMGLTEENKRDAVYETLFQSVNNSKKALTAGDVGFHYLVKALSDAGAGELLYEINARDDVPGYGFQLKKGATTLTESWAALEQVSNNHLMLGHIMEWFYAGLAGIDQTDRSVAFKEIKIAPQMVGKIGEAGATFDSPYGMISSHWKRNEAGYLLEVNIPVNTTALIYLPTAPGKKMSESGKPLPEMWITEKDPDKWIIRVGSGKYIFRQEFL